MNVQLQDLLLHGVRSAVPDSILYDAIDAHMAVTQYEWTGIPWYLATCSEHIARVFVHGARFAGAMQFIDHRWGQEFAQEHISGARQVREDLEKRLRLQVGDVLAGFGRDRDDAVAFAINGTLRPLLASDNPSHVAMKKAGIGCHGLSEIYRETVGEFYSNLKFSPPFGFPEPIFEFYSVERPETWMVHLFAQEFSASAQVPFTEATMPEEWNQSVDWGTSELVDILRKIDFNPEEIGRAVTRICGFLISLSGTFMVIHEALLKNAAAADLALRGVLVGAVLVINPELALKALEAIRRTTPVNEQLKPRWS